MSREIIPRARLYFGFSADKINAFAAVYQERVVPLLERHGLRGGIEQPPPLGLGIFSRLFSIDDLGDIARIHNALRDDSDWAALLYELGQQFGTTRLDGVAAYSFALYEIPAHSSRIAPLGPGTGSWFSYDVTDGIAGGQIRAMAEDHMGHIWLGCRGGISRFDGLAWRTYTTSDGLRSNDVWSLSCDQHGQLWCGSSGGGLHRFDEHNWIAQSCPTDTIGSPITAILRDRHDQLWCGTGRDGLYCLRGEQWASYTRADGLAGDSIKALCEDRAGHLWVGTDNGLCRFDGHTWTSDISPKEASNNSISSICEDDQARIWIGSGHFGAARFDGSQWTRFNDPHSPLYRNSIHSMLPDRNGAIWIGSIQELIHSDGENWRSLLPTEVTGHMWIHSLLEDREGNLWVGCRDRVYRYDKSWAHFDRSDGLHGPEVASILEDRHGQIWLSTYSSISSFDGETLTTYADTDGFPTGAVWGMTEHLSGDIWLATWHGALRYSRDTFRLFNAADGLYNLSASIYAGSHQDNVLCVYSDGKGVLWFGTQLEGIARYDGHSFRQFTERDGLPNDNIQWIAEDRAGHIWICCGGDGGDGGIARYDGATWHTYTKEDGLVDGMYSSIIEDAQGRMWIAAEGGASCFDGRQFANYTREQGLTQEGLWSLLKDAEGHIWFGSSGGGINRYDGQVFQSLSRKDGLVNNSIHQILQDRHGHYWFATNGGLTRFRPPPTTPPSIRIDAVVAGRRYDDSSPIEISDNIHLVSFEFSALSLKTAPGHIVYRYRLCGFDQQWTNTRQQCVEYAALPVGEYVFEVVAVDRDLVCSASSATCVLRVRRDERDEQIDELEQRVQERTQQLEDTHQKLRDAQTRLIAELEGELEKAHEMQMRLMPTAPPQTDRFEIDGRCIPANHVGGDFFQYFHRGEKLSLCLADVTGHAMEAAIPVVMFSGVLDAQIESEHELEELFARLNRTLYRNLDSRTFVCFTMAEIDLQTHTLRLANGGCPYPLYFNATTQTISEIQVEAYPLGVRGDTQYPTIELQLMAGDRLVFCSDGIVEAINAQRDLFGFDRAMATVHKGCLEQLSASALIDYLLATVREFTDGADQNDDMTCIVVNVQ